MKLLKSPAHARASASRPDRADYETNGGSGVMTGARHGAADTGASKILLALENGTLVFLLHQWVDLPPVDLVITPAGAKEGGEYWTYADAIWCRSLERLDRDALLRRLVERSRHGRITIRRV